MTNLLTIDSLSVATSRAQLVKDVSFSLAKGKCLALVGESGSGKTMTASAVAGLLPSGISATGRIELEGQNLATLDERSRRQIAGPGIGFVFQDAMSALHPLMSIREQITRPLRIHLGLNRTQAGDRALDLLDQVGIVDARNVLDGYIHQLSGGMRQRVMIAMAISCEPGLLIADEPTTALDANVQERILDLISRLREEHGIGVLLISHDLPVVSRHSDHVAVMYGGRMLESGETKTVLRDPEHPYTKGLLEASPERNRGARRLPVFSGRMLDLDDDGKGSR